MSGTISVKIGSVSGTIGVKMGSSVTVLGTIGV